VWSKYSCGIGNKRLSMWPSPVYREGSTIHDL
jgi:hypothetical protein